MSYFLFLDDERYPPDHDGIDWIIVRNVKDAIWTVTRRGMPGHIAFDHDLGPDPFGESDGETSEATRFVNWLEGYILDNQPDLRGFSYYVHSQNPIGVQNITGKLDPLIQHANGGYL